MNHTWVSHRKFKRHEIEKIQGPYHFAQHVGNFMANLCTHYPTCWSLQKIDEAIICFTKMVGLYHLGVVDFVPRVLFGTVQRRRILIQSDIRMTPQCNMKYRSRYTFRNTGVMGIIRKLEQYMTNKESHPRPSEKTNYIVAMMIHDAVENSGLKGKIEKGVGNCGNKYGQNMLRKLGDEVQNAIVSF